MGLMNTASAEAIEEARRHHAALKAHIQQLHKTTRGQDPQLSALKIEKFNLKAKLADLERQVVH
jgi:hypothetical protein